MTKYNLCVSIYLIIVRGGCSRVPGITKSETDKTSANCAIKTGCL